jgi:GTP cyclohydrolase II
MSVPLGESLALPVRISTALLMLAEYDSTPPHFSDDPTLRRLDSGLTYRLYDVPYSSEHEGPTMAVVVGQNRLLSHPDGPLIRLHSACAFSEVGDGGLLHWMEQGGIPQAPPADIRPSKECDCRAQRQTAQRFMVENGGVYFDLVEQEGRGAGLDVKREVYKLHAEEGLDTVEAYERLGVPFDSRMYDHCARFLLALGIDRVRLMTNNPRKINALVGQSILVTPVELIVGVTDENIGYLKTKRDKAGHHIPRTLRITDLFS